MIVCFSFSTGSTKAKKIKISEKTIPLRRLSISFSLKSLISFPTIYIINQDYSILKLLTRINLVIFIICVLTISTLKAKEPFLAMHMHTYSNDVQKFSANNYSFECTPYGVHTLERLYKNTKKGSNCHINIEKYYKNNPKDKYIARNIFKKKQFYHVEIKNTECIVHIKGQISFSEFLLSKGLAIIKLDFRDEEYYAYYNALQLKAKEEKRGLWKENIFNDCMVEADR